MQVRLADLTRGMSVVLERSNIIGEIKNNLEFTYVHAYRRKQTAQLSTRLLSVQSRIADYQGNLKDRKHRIAQTRVRAKLLCPPPGGDL